ncbi:hypothetical protein [Sporomusa termitida]|uniref:hypothetical protein n=1 Tax=Sporomusa termitida TaxID=2377 RepID=UPI001478D703|nr:hypothetical protein [Sporomusa termitida]
MKITDWITKAKEAPLAGASLALVICNKQFQIMKSGEDGSKNDDTWYNKEA